MNQSTPEPTFEVRSEQVAPFPSSPSSANRASLKILPFAPLLAFLGFSMVLATSNTLLCALNTGSDPILTCEASVESNGNLLTTSPSAVLNPLAEVEVFALGDLTEETDAYVTRLDLTRLARGEKQSEILATNGADLTVQGTRQWCVVKVDGDLYVQAWRGVMLTDAEHLEVAAWRTESFLQPVLIPVSDFTEVSATSVTTAVNSIHSDETGVREETFGDEIRHVQIASNSSNIIETVTLPAAEVEDVVYEADADADEASDEAVSQTYTETDPN